MGLLRRFRQQQQGFGSHAHANEPREESQPARPTGGRSVGQSLHPGQRLGDRFEIRSVIGEGGFGVVYLADSLELGVVAIKTIRPELLRNDVALERFRHEALLWATFGHHPNIVRVHAVMELGGQLCIVMEYIEAPDPGCSSLADYLERQAPDLNDALWWAIQVCHGLEYAYSEGLRAHRDLKPENIFINHSGDAKVADLGLAGMDAAVEQAARQTANNDMDDQADLLRTLAGTAMGTITHMPPEQFSDASKCDERSDIYAFGVILYQLASRGALPFLAPLPAHPRDLVSPASWTGEMRQLHAHASVPRLDSPLSPVIARCLQKRRDQRYQTFADVRRELEELFRALTGYEPPSVTRWELTPKELSNRGGSLDALGRHEEAFACYQQAVEVDPSLGQPWHGMGSWYAARGQWEQALPFLDRATELELDSFYAWNDKGVILTELGRFDEALACLERASALDPRSVRIRRSKAQALEGLGRLAEAEASMREALHLDSLDVQTWRQLGELFNRDHRFDDAESCFCRITEIDPDDQLAWKQRGHSFEYSGQAAAAAACWERASALDSDDAVAWFGLGVARQGLADVPAAVDAYKRCVALNSTHAFAWANLCGCLAELEQFADGRDAGSRAVTLNPRNPIAWWHKAKCELKLMQHHDAAASLRRLLSVEDAPRGMTEAADDLLGQLENG